ncbi:MAG: sigma-54 dependent transcriptional regulator [Candidatus Omnitrophota bacterium]
MPHRKILPNRILVVDDEPGVSESVRVILEDDYEILSAASGEEALKLIAEKSIDLVFLDITLPGIDGMETLKRIKDAGEDANVVMLTATNTANTAVQAMKLGAFDYVTKPFEPEEIAVIAKKALDNYRLVKEINYFRSQIQPTSFDNIVGKSRKLHKVLELISKVVKNDATVIIAGESGTGKELVVRAIHYNSLRKENPFVVLNCAAIPENLVETELFGYEKGAFTGADASKPGKFELADQGTMFLDEISALRLDMQAKLLRVLQEKEVERVGGTKTIKVDVRIICATNIDLKQAVGENKFREDLYYRLNVVPIYIAPLRERKEDIPLLIEHFLKIYNEKIRKSVKGISREAMRYLVNYDWPGNIRELENMMERLVVLTDKEIIEANDLPFDIFLEDRCKTSNFKQNGLGLKQARDRFEKEYILVVLEKAGNNQTEAARLLGIHRNTLMLKLGQLGIKKATDVRR